jgi:ComEC/Rec2-related protein
MILTKETLSAGPKIGTGEGVAHSKRWYVALVRMHHEKKVAERLDKMGIENFVPVQQEVHQWSDRRKVVESVLLPMMVFVHADPKERKEVLSFSTVSRYMVMRGESSPTFKMQALMLREQIVKKFRTWNLEDDVLAIISALTVGDKSKLTREIKATYNAAGVSHILALSGLHIGILSMILSWLFYPLRRVCGGKWIAGFLIVGLLWGFAFLSGLSPSVIRAVTMFSAYVVASIFSEDRFSGFSALTLTAFIMLIYQPMYLFDVGFQLSFMAVLGIFLFYPLIDSLFVVRNKIVAYLWNIISLSLAAQLATLPLILYYFGTFPVYFLLSNLVVAPIAVFILSATLLALALGVFPVAANFVVQGLDFAVRTLNEVMEQIQHWSGAQITSAYLSVWQAWLLAVAIVTLWRYVVCRNARRLIVFLLTVNVLIVSFFGNKGSWLVLIFICLVLEFIPNTTEILMSCLLHHVSIRLEIFVLFWSIIINGENKRHFLLCM